MNPFKTKRTGSFSQNCTPNHFWVLHHANPIHGTPTIIVTGLSAEDCFSTLARGMVHHRMLVDLGLLSHFHAQELGRNLRFDYLADMWANRRAGKSRGQLQSALIQAMDDSIFSTVIKETVKVSRNDLKEAFNQDQVEVQAKAKLEASEPKSLHWDLEDFSGPFDWLFNIPTTEVVNVKTQVQVASMAITKNSKISSQINHSNHHKRFENDEKHSCRASTSQTQSTFSGIMDDHFSLRGNFLLF